jgi:translocation and assembly module TamB
MKRALRIILIVLLVLGVAAFALRVYLRSSNLASRVASQLAAVYGGPVAVEAVEVGLRGSSLQGLKLFEEGDTSSSRPWLTAADIETDYSLWSYLKGKSLPEKLKITGAAVTLRFDRSGHSLTRFPKQKAAAGGKFPSLHVKQSRLVVQQEGRPDFVVEGINADLQTDGDHLVLTGDVADPVWGEWTLAGCLNRDRTRTRVTLKTRRNVHVTLAKLKSLPFVPPVTWKEVQLEGDTPGEIEFDSGPKNFSYRVTLHPVHTRVVVPVIQLVGRETHGTAVIDNGLVRLTDVEGLALGGTLRTTADFDFRGDGSRLNFRKVQAKRLKVASLPRSWKFPKVFGGRLTGEAHMLFLLHKGQVRTRGRGEGAITESKIGGKIIIGLHSGPRGFRFAQSNPSGGVRKPAPSAFPARNSHPVAFLPGPRLTMANPQPGPQGDGFLPGTIINRAAAGIGALSHGIARTGGRLAQGVAQAFQKSRRPRKKASRTVDVNLKLEDVDAALFVKGVGAKLPFHLTGHFSVQVKASIPLNSTGDLKSYRASGTLTSPRLTLGEVSLRRVRAHVTYAKGELRLDELSARVPARPGAPRQQRGGVGRPAPSAATIRGNASLSVVPLGDLTGRLTLANIPLSQAGIVVAALKQQLTGAFGGTFRASVPAKKLTDVAAWTASGQVTARDLQAFGLHGRDLTAKVALRNGTLSLTDASLVAEGTPVHSTVNLKLERPFRYHGRVELGGLDLATLRRLSPDFRPPISLAGNFGAKADVKGTLSPPTFQVAGTGTASGLALEGVKLQTVKFRWEIDPDRLKLSDLKARLYRGDLTGSAVVPLKKTAAGSVELRFNKMDVAALARAIPKNPVKVSGRASGTVQGTFPPASNKGERSLNLSLDMKAARLRIQGIPAERVTGSVAIRKGKVEYHLQGSTLGGRFKVEGAVPSQEERTTRTTKTTRTRTASPCPCCLFRPCLLAQTAPPRPDGRLTLEGIRLSRLWLVLGVQRFLGPLRGRVDLELDFRHEPPDLAPVGSGRVVLGNLRWGEAALAGNVRSDLVLTRKELRLQNLSGNLGRGVLDGQLALSLKAAGQGWFSLGLRGVEVSQLLGPWPDLARRFEGPLDARLRGTLGREWHGTAHLLLRRGKVFGLEVDEWRLPIDWAFAPGSGRGEVDLRENTASVALGRASSRASLSWGTGTRLEGELRFSNVSLRHLIRQFSESSHFATGKLSGRVEFSGSDLHSPADLTATINAKLSQARALSIPVLNQITPFLRGGISAATTFNSGDLRARLAGGVVRLQRFSLSSNVLRLIIEGTVTVPQGRLSLDVNAMTGQFGAGPVTRRLLSAVPLAGGVSLGVLQAATALLSPRLVHLRVTGTVRNPVVRFQPLLLLTEEAVRFFAGRSAGVPGL